MLTNTLNRGGAPPRRSPPSGHASPGHGSSGHGSPVPRLLAEALQHHRAGRLADAELLYRRILMIDRGHADSLHLVGLIAHARGRHDLALSMIRQAVANNPRAASYHVSLGHVHVDQGRIEAAIACYRRAVDLAPDLPAAQGALGNAVMRQGRLVEAIECLRRAVALTPDEADAHNNLGIALRRSGQPEAAAACFRQAVACRPDFAAAHNNLGNACADQGKIGAAVDAYRRALMLQPDYAAAHNNLGNARLAQGNLLAAEGSFRAALSHAPDYAEAHNNLGNVMKVQGRLDAAVASFRQALALREDYVEAEYNLGNALREQGALDEAVACFRSALRRRPDFADAQINLGNTLAEQRRLDEAVGCYVAALRVDPGLADGHFNLGIALLARGDLAAGWQEYEWRWKIPRMASACRNFPQPQWRGEAVAGRTLLIHAEQGFGDTLQFCRYATLAAARGAKVILEAPPPLVRLLRTLAGVAQVVECGDALPAFDVHCPMLSLPFAFGTTGATIPNVAPYLHADAVQVAAWQARLGALAGPGLRVGLVWAGDPRRHTRELAAVDGRRSLAPARLAPLLDVAGVRFFSLQKSGPAAPEAFGVVDVMGEMDDFADTAALVANLDLVISVDTAVAHLAGALGKPVWLLDRFDSCWRWLSGRRDSPWYPTLRLYRQPCAGDWDAVLAEVAADLRALAVG
jgi:tetratricopeptide (TPR) repeat protein